VKLSPVSEFDMQLLTKHSYLVMNLATYYTINNIEAFIEDSKVEIIFTLGMLSKLEYSIKIFTTISKLGVVLCYIATSKEFYIKCSSEAQSFFEQITAPVAKIVASKLIKAGIGEYGIL